MIMFHQIFLLERDWSERSTWPNIPQPKLQTLRPLRLVIVSDVFILEQIVSTIKYLCILSRHIEAIVYLQLKYSYLGQYISAAETISRHNRQLKGFIYQMMYES